MDEEKNDVQIDQSDENGQDSGAISKAQEEWQQEKERLENEIKERDEQIERLARAKREAKKEARKATESKESLNEPDYGRLAYLQSRGIDNPDDIKVVQEEADRLRLPLTDILGMEHIQARLKANKETREAKEGMPSGGNRAGGNTQQDVEYWLARGETPDDQALAEKVVEARMKKEDQSNRFADSLYTG